MKAARRSRSLPQPQPQQLLQHQQQLPTLHLPRGLQGVRRRLQSHSWDRGGRQAAALPEVPRTAAAAAERRRTQGLQRTQPGLLPLQVADGARLDNGTAAKRKQ